MATYRLEAKVIGRSQGRSATASAAYQAAQKLEDKRTGAVFDYTRKRDVLHSEIVAPAGTPDWMRDRTQLWNAVETVEKRKDSQLARVLLLSLPHELTQAQRVDLVREFVSSEFVSRGMIADIALHAPDREGDSRNHHAHVMLTMRELTGGGFGKKVREWNATEELEQWRADWASTINHHLERAGHAARVDHRSLADQGLDREPEPKQGPVATEIERQGRASHAGDDRRAAQVRNAEREQIAAELTAVRAEIIDLDEERRKRQAQEPTAPGAPRIATDNAGMVAQQGEAMRQVSSPRKLRFFGDPPEPEKPMPAQAPAEPMDERTRRFEELLKKNFDKSRDPDRGNTR